MPANALIRIGTRGSPLALRQAEMVRSELAVTHHLDHQAISIEVIRTSGDRIQDRPLSEVGGKGLFTKEIEDALLADAIDLAVHSAKDMATILPEGLIIAGCLAREDARDAFISRKAASIAQLPQGAVIGSASLRRQAQLLRLRPDLRTVILRGNVETRLRKIDGGVADATLLALAGLKRLGLEQTATAILDTDEFLPAPGQGIVALQTRARDSRINEMARAIDHRETHCALQAERAFLAVLDGSCRTPIAGYAQLSGRELQFRGMILRPDGSEAHETKRLGNIEDASRLGIEAGQELKTRASADFFEPS